jgi:flagella basal body P-ring formation protein FlgA
VDEVVGKRTRRLINAKTVIRSDLITMPPMVQKGDVVVIVAESQGMRISALGEIREKGHRGSRVRVRNVDSKEMIYAWVLDHKTVRVEF